MPRTVVVLAGAFLLPAAAHAASSDDATKRFEIMVGGTQSIVDTQVSLGTSTGGLNATLVFKDLFDLPVRNRFFRAEGLWKFGDRSYLDLSYVNVDRANDRRIQEDIQFGGFIF